MPADSNVVRKHLCEALYADLIGPSQGVAHHPDSRELLSVRPTSWYLTGFLAPEEGRDEDPQADEGSMGMGDDVSAEEANAEEQEPKQRKFYPASFGVSVLLPSAASCKQISAEVSFAQYIREKQNLENKQDRPKTCWRRVPQTPVSVDVPLDASVIKDGIAVPNAQGVTLRGQLVEITEAARLGLPVGTRALSLFLVNRQPVRGDEQAARDESTLFQVQMTLRCESGFVPRPDQRGQASNTDWDARVLELQYRNQAEIAVGHNIAVKPIFEKDGLCRQVETRWIPKAEVALVDARRLDNVIISMDDLAKIDSHEAIDQALAQLPLAYRLWIDETLRGTKLDSKFRQDTRDALVLQADEAASRIEEGIRLLKEDAEVLQAFCFANDAMAKASRQRTPERGTPNWRLFQLAFLLYNLAGIANAKHADRKKVDLIFFPTGGGKTEAYLGVIAFTLLLRRLRGQGRDDKGLGVAVLLRYTLRLLTLDQLERATALICALEVLRRQNKELLGAERFAMGLWVGRSTTPNRISDFADQLSEYRNGRLRNLPSPLQSCPWCQTALTANSLDLRPAPTKAERVGVRCMNHVGSCPFANPDKEGIPLVFIDEQVYRELPCFVIATVDKFAMLPWLGKAATLFGRVHATAEGRFYGAGDKAPKAHTPLPNGLRPPELIVQDELHLISGPLGTMVGLYEVAIEKLCTHQDASGHPVLPKIMASTATANHADKQIESLFGRKTRIFPPQGIDALETYFSEINTKDPGRLYIGVAAPGHPLKRVLLRTYVALLGAAAKARANPAVDAGLADAYMTLVGYFNSLRELGGMRRLVEDDVKNQCESKEQRVPVEGHAASPWFLNRSIGEPAELTSRVDTISISTIKGKVAKSHQEQGTDVLLASNMISVGVDIDRLGLMVMGGQPKTTSEYIQASSRVGRSRQRPGLVVTCYNVTRPRDRSHYEHFVAYHQSFYRYVEAQSVTPFAERALDRGLSGALVALVRLSVAELTPPNAVMHIAQFRAPAQQLVEQFVSRAAEEHQDKVRRWATNRLDNWEKAIAKAANTFCYSRYDDGPKEPTLLRLALDEKLTELPPERKKFIAPTSMRDVEPTVHLWLSQPGTRVR